VKAIEAGGDDFPHQAAQPPGARRARAQPAEAQGATDALEDSVRKLRELEKVRDDLLKMMVHDLKSPLTGVLATLEMVADGDFGPVADGPRAALGEARGKADELLALIDDLLEVARIEEGGVNLRPEPLRPAELLADLARDWAVRFTAAHAVARVDAAADAPTFLGDRALLRRVLNNLLENALTHATASPTGPGGHLEVRVTVRAADGDGVLFTVADNGPGVAAEYRELIFRKFESVKLPGASRARGSGLGLAFCKLVVEAHGGHVWVQSAAADGTGAASTSSCRWSRRGVDRPGPRVAPDRVSGWNAGA
jgi:signal transduction histidine kinase